MDVLSKVIGIITKVLEKKPEEITKETTFEQMGCDELDNVEIILNLEEAFDIEISDENAEKFTTVESIVSFIETLKKESGN